MGVFRADAHVQVFAGIGLGKETHEDNLFFEGVQDGGNIAEVQCSARQVGGTSNDDLRLTGSGEDVGECRANRINRAAQLRPTRGRGRLRTRAHSL